MPHRAFPNHDGRDFPLDTQRDFPLAGSEGGAFPAVGMAVTTFLVPGSTGNVDITTLDMNGITPKAVYFMCTNHRSTDDATPEAPHAQITTGAADGTNQWWVNTYSEDNVGNTDNSRIAHTDACLRVHDPASVAGSLWANATFVSFIPGGVRVNFTNVNRPNIRVIAVFFGGDDVSVDVGSQDLGTGTSAIDITAPGFEPDVVFLNSASDVANTLSNALVLAHGVLINNGVDEQNAICLTEFHAQTAGDLNSELDTNNCLATNTYALTGGTFDANGFSLTPSASAANDIVYYLALKVEGKSVDLVQFGTPTSTGNQTYDPGFTPEFYLAVISNNTSDDTQQDTDGVGMGVGTDDNQAALSMMLEFNADPTNCSCDTRDGVAFQGVDASDADAIQASFVSFGAGGATFNYDAVLGSAYRGYIFMLGE
jgi:hypothetical protein